MKTKIPFTKILPEKIIDQLVEDGGTKKEFIAAVREYAQINYMIPLTVIQFCYSND